jgi:tRNA-splicing ligase RtcB
MDADWSGGPLTRELKDKAWAQLGTSGSGNHFVEWGLLTVTDPADAAELGVEPGSYVALLSHSGSRGSGAAICAHYSKVAADRLPAEYANFKRLAWLGLDTAEGREYWHAMNLMGRYAAANHEIIHDNVVRLAGAEALKVVENHHNFAWKEIHDGKEYVVHRKGATPAGKGVLGIIPGNMADPAYVVRGKGEADSLASAAHGAGRRMSRTAAKKMYQWGHWRGELKRRGVRLLAAGLDEVPGVYKDIRQVMGDQSDLVETVAEFHPKVVMMCGDNSRAED